MSTNTITIPEYGGTFRSKGKLLAYLYAMRDELAELRKEEVKRNKSKRLFGTLGEYYDCAVYLKALAYNNLLTYPFSFCKSERPDFILNEAEGLEHIRATPENYQKFLTRIEDSQSMQCYSKKGFGEQETLALELLSRHLTNHSAKVAKYLENNAALGTIDAVCKVELPMGLEPSEAQRMLNDYLTAASLGFRNIGIITNIRLISSEYNGSDIVIWAQQNNGETRLQILDAPYYQREVA